ncbi:MAG: methylthioribulose 1-phosphate dehydratase [Planctomycetota bacterium]|nr:MAG: methylthioribulose 1-phosphate dehydratase [Planctomycetota bacterium]
MNSTTEFPDYLIEYGEQIDALRELGYTYWQRGWSRGTSSNYSVVVSRDPLQLVITASGKDKGRLSREDFVLVDAAGKKVHAEAPASSAETLLHCVAAECIPDVGAVLHTHSPWSTVLSQRYFAAGGIELHDYEMLKGLRGVSSHQEAVWLPIFDNTQDIPALAEQVRQRFTSAEEPLTHAYLIRQHGIYTWGRDLAEAARHIEVLEFLLECLGRSAAIA